jgi:hypothetical protein
MKIERVLNAHIYDFLFDPKLFPAQHGITKAVEIGHIDPVRSQKLRIRLRLPKGLTPEVVSLILEQREIEAINFLRLRVGEPMVRVRGNSIVLEWFYEGESIYDEGKGILLPSAWALLEAKDGEDLWLFEDQKGLAIADRPNWAIMTTDCGVVKK